MTKFIFLYIYMEEIIILIIIIIGYFLFMNREHFDTYRNHDFGANAVYSQAAGKQLLVADTSRKARYDWSARDPAGMTVYDKFYNEFTAKNSPDLEYAYKDTETDSVDGVYDTKFDNLTISNLGGYKIADMYDRNPATAYDFHSGEVSVISQKNY
jgi:hypothetical protein